MKMKCLVVYVAMHLNYQGMYVKGRLASGGGGRPVEGR